MKHYNFAIWSVGPLDKELSKKAITSAGMGICIGKGAQDSNHIVALNWDGGALKEDSTLAPYLKDVAALPCETVMFQKSYKFENTLPKDVLKYFCVKAKCR